MIIHVIQYLYSHFDREHKVELGLSIIGKENRREIGTVRAAFSTYSSEETEEDDIERSLETVYAVIPARYAPAGGFRRSMVLQCGEDSWRMLNPVCLGTLWSVKCLRVHL